MSDTHKKNHAALHIVEKTMTTDQLIKNLYKSPNTLTIEHFKMVNSHLKNNIADIGQVVLVSPPGAQSCTREEAAFQDTAREVDKTLAKLDKQERRVLAEKYDFLSTIASTSGTLLGVAQNIRDQHLKQVATILKEIEQAYITGYSETNPLKSKAFFERRKVLFKRLDAALNRFAQPSIGGNLIPGNIKSNLGLSTKSIMHAWNNKPNNPTSIPNFSKNYETVAKSARNLKRLGYVGIGLTGIDAYASVQKACTVGDEEACKKAGYTQYSKAAGSIVGGAFVGWLSGWLSCTVIFGLPSGGTSALWCGIVVGAGSGYLGGRAGGYLGEKGGEAIYTNYIRK